MLNCLTPLGADNPRVEAFEPREPENGRKNAAIQSRFARPCHTPDGRLVRERVGRSTGPIGAAGRRRRVWRLALRQTRHQQADQAGGFAEARRDAFGRQRSRVVPRPASAMPQVPAGFKIELFAEGLSGPRQMRVAPNGDIFVAETRAGSIRVLRAADGDTKALRQRDLRQRTQPAVRDCVLSRVATIRNGFTSPTPTGSFAFPTQPATLKAAGKARNRGRRAAAWRRSLDARHRLLPRRQADVGLGRLRQQ